jgi:hypothetical protein
MCGPMNPNAWDLHAAVFDLARAQGLGTFRVDYKAHPAGVVIELVMEAPPDLDATHHDGEARDVQSSHVVAPSSGRQRRG